MPDARLVRRDSRNTVDKMLQDAFDRVDSDKDGRVDAMDIQRGLRAAGVKTSPGEIAALMERLDPENHGQITFSDFHTLHESFIAKVFSDFDRDGKGYLDDVALQDALERLGVKVTLQEAQTMIEDLHPVDVERVELHDFHSLYLLLRAKMVKSSPMLEHMMWDPDMREISQEWLHASIDMGEAGLRTPLPLRAKAGKKSAEQVSPLVKFCGGALSGVIEALLLTPLDVTKTRLQLDKTGTAYKGFIDCGKRLFKAEGIPGLYKGFTPWTIHVVIKNGTRFYFNAIFRQLLADRNGQVSGMNEFIAGAFAGAAEAVMIVTPFEVIKTRLQGQDIIKGQKPKYRGFLQTTTTIAKQEGVTALWKGVIPTIGRQALNQAGCFWANNSMKKYYWKLEDGESLPLWKSLLTGMLSGIPGPVINGPLDVIKTRLMAQESGKAAAKYRGMVHAFGVIAKEEGVLALYKGLVPRLTRLCPSYGIQWLVMDSFTAYFAKRKNE